MEKGAAITYPLPLCTAMGWTKLFVDEGLMKLHLSGCALKIHAAVTDSAPIIPCLPQMRDVLKFFVNVLSGHMHTKRYGGMLPCFPIIKDVAESYGSLLHGLYTRCL